MNTASFAESRDAQVMWKSADLIEVACRLIHAGIERLNAGVDYFGPDDLPEDFTAGGPGLTGSAVFMLRSARIIADYFGSPPDSGVFQGRRKSRRASANGRKVCLYEIANAGLARAFLERHGHAMETPQRELAL